MGGKEANDSSRSSTDVEATGGHTQFWDKFNMR
jgi:hypothetical protein